MRESVMLSLVLVVGLSLELAPAARSEELKAEHVLNLKGDGPDGKGNTDDDTWGFWFEVGKNGPFHRLSLATASLSAEQRKNGIRDEKAKRGKGKVRGPVGSMVPGDDVDGWIYSRDWDGRFEGIWADRKTGALMAHPYAEKTAHCAVAISYRIPKTGVYAVNGKLTDLAVAAVAPHDGILWRIEHVVAGKATVLSKGGPIGDGKGPDTGAFEAPKTAFAQGDLVRLVIHPNVWWGADLTRIDSFKIESTE